MHVLQALTGWFRGTTIPDSTPSLGPNFFPEEPLALSAKQGFGFFPASPGLQLKDGRYRVLRKLGRGQYSSTWLALDSQASEDGPERYRAIKILTAHATFLHQDGLLLELEILKAISSGLSSEQTLRLPRLHDYFETDGLHGQHLCLVQPVLSTDVSKFRRIAPSKTLQVSKVKIIIAQIVDALAALHAANIIHADVKPDNVLFRHEASTATIQKLLDESTPAVEHEFSLDGRQRYPVMRSQPIPHPYKWDDPGDVVQLYSICLADLGHAQWANREPPTKIVGSYALRAPEVILAANFDSKVDIWSVGCMTFELLTGHWLFHPQRGATWRIEDDHLSRMLEHTGDHFSEEFLAKCQNRDDYFDQNGKLLRIGELFPVSLEQAMANHGVAEAEVSPAADFMRACLRLDPKERATACDLRQYSWLQSVCC